MISKERISFLVVLLALFSTITGVAGAQGITGLEPGIRLGIQLGNPTSLVGGYRLNSELEINGLVGTNYNQLTLGANALFTMAKPKIESQLVPITIGPEVLLGIWNESWNTTWKHDTASGIALEILFMARAETTLPKVPVNFYLDLGLGISVIPVMNPVWTSTLGIRYLF